MSLSEAAALREAVGRVVYEGCADSVALPQPLGDAEAVPRRLPVCGSCVAEPATEALPGGETLEAVEAVGSKEAEEQPEALGVKDADTVGVPVAAAAVSVALEQ